MKLAALLLSCTFVLSHTSFPQALPLKWEVTLGTWPPDIFAEYIGKIDGNNTGKIFVHWALHDGKYGYAIYDGATHALQHIDTSFTSPTFDPMPFGIHRIAPPFHPDFDGNGVTDIFVKGTGQWGFLDPSTGAYTVFNNANSFQIIDVDDIDNDGIYELITEEWSAGPYMLRVYNTGRPVTTSVQESNFLPSKLGLSQNYPNPFNPNTRIQYDLSVTGAGQLEIFDIMGRNVRSLSFSHQDAGSHEVLWDGKDHDGTPVSSGTYFYQLTIHGTSLAKKMLLLR